MDFFVVGPLDGVVAFVCRLCQGGRALGSWGRRNKRQGRLVGKMEGCWLTRIQSL